MFNRSRERYRPRPERTTLQNAITIVTQLLTLVQRLDQLERGCGAASDIEKVLRELNTVRQANAGPKTWPVTRGSRPQPTGRAAAIAGRLCVTRRNAADMLQAEGRPEVVGDEVAHAHFLTGKVVAR